MIYIKLDGKTALVQLLLENRYYSISELVDIISIYAEEESDESDCSNDDFYHRKYREYD